MRRSLTCRSFAVGMRPHATHMRKTLPACNRCRNPGQHRLRMTPAQACAGIPHDTFSRLPVLWCLPSYIGYCDTL